VNRLGKNLPKSPTPTSESVVGMISVETSGRSTKFHWGLSWFWFRKPMGGRRTPARRLRAEWIRRSTCAVSSAISSVPCSNSSSERKRIRLPMRLKRKMLKRRSSRLKPSPIPSSRK